MHVISSIRRCSPAAPRGRRSSWRCSYAIPRTAVLGAVLVTGSLGGAAATHLRIGEAFAPPVLLGALAWLGPYLRDARLRALLPLRRAG